MKIHELSQHLNVNPETIRMYRNKGLLRPVRNPHNGYYEYTDADLYSLFFIRELRGANLPLQTITEIVQNDSTPEMLDNFNHQILEVHNQIKQLSRKLDILKRTRDHLIECHAADQEVTFMESRDTKYDIPDFLTLDDPRLDIWLNQIDLCTLSICIDKDLLNQELPPEVPFQVAIGTYQKVIRRNNLPLLEPMSVCPKGTYLSMIVELDSLKTIPRDILLPLQCCAREHDCHFTTNTTAFLIRANHRTQSTRFLFRLRAQVEKNKTDGNC